MTDSMKFGPEWLRNMSADSTNPSLLSSGSGASSSGNNNSTSAAPSASTSSSYNVSGTGGHHTFTLFGSASGSTSSYTPVPRNTFPEFRYGREEMLSLFDKNYNMPEILPSFKKIFVEKVQYPLALTPSTDEEMLTQGPPVPAQRPSWIQRSPVSFSNSTRGIGRGGSVDRGRMRGKSNYHQIYQRPTAMFEDDVRSIASLKSDRGWPERNGAGDSLGGGVGSGSVIGGVGSGIGLGSDWNGTPASSPRKELSSHPRNMENWRRNRNEDGSGDASVSGGGLGNTDGWRIGSGGNGGTSTSFSSTHRWGRSTSWRDEDVPSVAIDGGYGGSSICMQRSYSTITTVNERGGYMNSGGNSGSLSKTMQNSSNYMGGLSSSSNQSSTRLSTVNSSASRNHQWSSGSGGNAGGGNSGDGDDNLPEWAMENPSDGGGTFDATGAFHGSVDEDETSTSADGSNEKSHSNGSIGQQRKKSLSSSEGSTRSGQDNFKNNESPETATETLTIATGKNKQAESDREAESVSTVTSDSSLTDGKPPLQQTFESESDESNLEISVKNVGNAQITESGQTQSQQEIDMEKTSGDVISIEKTPVSTSSVVAISQVSTSNSTYYNSNDSISLLSKSTMRLTSVNSGNGQKEFSDRMQEVADDMIEKLIMDDDTMGDSNSCVEAKAVDASLSTTATANNIRAANTYATPVVAAMLKQSTHQQNAQNSVSPTLPPTMADVGHPKCMPLYGGGVVAGHATMQQHHHLQQQQLVAAAANLAAAARLPHTAAAPTDLWYYRDPQSKVQGPFTAMEMTEWYRAGYFNENLYVRRLCDTHFRALGELIKLCHDNMPFTHSHLIPIGLDNIHVPSATGARPQKPQILNDFTLKQQSDQREELKGNVTAAADFLSGAVKNLSPVDMSHVLSIHFQMLQDQYIRHQEVIIFNELSKNECFQRLTSSEKEAIVRRKLQHHGLPEYLTSLAGLNNSLTTLNPTAGNQLYDAIAECSKKEHIFRNAPGSSSGSSGNAAQQHQQQTNTFHDTDNFMINSQQQQQQQLQAQFVSAPYGNILSTVGTDGNAGVGGNKLGRSGDDLTTNELLNNYNLRMFLPGDNTNSSHLTISAPSNANDFLNEQQILAPPTSMVHMWLPPLAGNPTNTTPLQTPLISGQQSQQSSSPAQQQSNQWGNSLMVGLPVSVMTGTQLSSAGVGMVQGQPQQKPSSMWDLSALDQVQSQEQQLDHNSVSFEEQNSESALQNAKSKEQTISTPQKQQQRKNVDNVAESQTEMSVCPQVNDPIISASLSSVVPLPTPTKQRKDDPVEKYQQNIGNKRNNSKHQQSSSNKVGVKDDNLNNRKNEEERRRELADEKRRQKEEKKRQLLEDEKRRLQQIEEEKRRQTLEEKERQQQIKAQRRKALLGTNISPNTSASATNNNMNNVAFVSVGGTTKKEQQRVQSSVAPWSMQTTAAATKSGPCLAEIQKAERRERRADQQRQMEILEKQIRANAAEVNDAMLKWNASPMPVKSLTEIQAEEAKRLANEQLEIQRRKEQEQQAALTIGALGGSNVPVMATGVNSISAIWSGPKVWGSTSTAGFWEEPIKFSAAVAATATNQTTTAAVVAANLGGGNNTGSNSGNNKQAQTIQQKLQVGNASMMSSTNTSTPNVSHQSQGGNTARNLRKSQTVSIMQNTSANNKSTKANQQNSVVNTTKTNGNKQQQQQKGVSNDGGGSGTANEKKTSVKIQHNTVASGNNSLVTSKRDDYENEFTTWCTKSLNNMNAKVDVPTFVTFLQDLESPYEVKDYIRMYLGENKEYTEFSKQFLERRSKYKNLQRAQNAHNDDMCKPAPAITPFGNDSSDNKGKQKKIKKNKMTKLDARILGFSVTAAEGRINVGARDYVDAP